MFKIEWNEFFGEKFYFLVSGHVVPKIRFFKFYEKSTLGIFLNFYTKLLCLKGLKLSESIFFGGKPLFSDFHVKTVLNVVFQVQWKFEVWFFFIWALGIIRVKMSYKMNLQNEFCRFHNEFKHGMFLVFCMK